ncbi:MAG: flagellar hook protein FlgE [Comamonas sp.]|nr:flagellar hook protein FlgE [Candidatus Comamonas equi]
MGFNHALSGLNAASKSLDVIGHNIANSGTTGFKSSRAEFSEAVASALGSASGDSYGIGVSTAAVTQLFKQGNITPTGNNLDVAINGNGFFVVQQLDGSDAYTRSGTFRVDDEGYLRTINGDSVLGHPVDPTTGIILKNQRVSMVFPTGKPIAAQQTAKATVELNLDARAKNAAGDAAANPPVAATPRATYGTSFSVFDQQGSSVPVNLYFEKSDANQWTIYSALDDLTAVPPVINAPGGFMQMNSVGQPVGMGTVGDIGPITTTPGTAAIPGTPGTPEVPASGTATQPVTYRYIDQAESNPNLRNKELAITRTWTYTYSDIDPAVGHIVAATYTDSPDITDPAVLAGGTSTGNTTMAFTLPVEVDSSKVNPNQLAPFDVEVNLGGITQFGTGFAVSKLSQDGFASGSMTSINISEDGTIIANYSNGIKRSEGQLALADFRNTQGLAAIGGDKWMMTPESGEEIPGTAKSGTFGSLMAGALEESNVDLTAELVNMMTAQRAYQASAQAIKTQDQVFSTLVNLR